MRPTRDEVLMHNAWDWSRRSTCSRASVGVVIAQQGRVVCTGYNGAPQGLKHCDHNPDSATPSNIVNGGCENAVHAEANAIAFGARFGVCLDQAQLYTTLCPCLPCAQLIINAGINAVFYLKDYRDSRGLQLLKKAKVDLTLMSLDDILKYA